MLTRWVRRSGATRAACSSICAPERPTRENSASQAQRSSSSAWIARIAEQPSQTRKFRGVLPWAIELGDPAATVTAKLAVRPGERVDREGNRYAWGQWFVIDKVRVLVAYDRRSTLWWLRVVVRPPPKRRATKTTR